MHSTNMQISEHYDRFIAAQIANGTYRDADDVIHAGLRLLEQQAKEDEQRLAVLRKLTEEGIAELDRGEGLAFDNIDELDAYLSTLGRNREQGGSTRADA